MRCERFDDIGDAGGSCDLQPRTPTAPSPASRTSSFMRGVRRSIPSFLLHMRSGVEWPACFLRVLFSKKPIDRFDQTESGSSVQSGSTSRDGVIERSEGAEEAEASAHADRPEAPAVAPRQCSDTVKPSSPSAKECCLECLTLTCAQHDTDNNRCEVLIEKESRHYRYGDALEITVDVRGFNPVARQLLYQLRGQLPKSIMQLGILVQGVEEFELPEGFLGLARLDGLDRPGRQVVIGRWDA
eukprot:g11277.t2